MPLQSFCRTQPLSRSELTQAGQGPRYYWHQGVEHRAIHVIAEGDWTLTGKATDPAKNGKEREFLITLPAGEYSFDFPPASVNLALVVIDPDPGGGTVG